MFTGIVEETGTTVRIMRTAEGYQMTFRAEEVLSGTRLGDSIAVNGTCLTVTALDADSFTVGLAPETLDRTNLGSVGEGDAVNLERSLTPNSRIGGHFVQGHVDGLGIVTSLRPDRDSVWVTVKVDPGLMRWIVPKGYIALDGISLTVVDVHDDLFTVMLITYTREHVTLADQSVGYGVNVEVDILGKYVDRMITQRFGPSGVITREFLAEHGYE